MGRLGPFDGRRREQRVLELDDGGKICFHGLSDPGDAHVQNRSEGSAVIGRSALGGTDQHAAA
jgi:hypothetical protein